MRVTDEEMEASADGRQEWRPSFRNATLPASADSAWLLAVALGRSGSVFFNFTSTRSTYGSRCLFISRWAANSQNSRFLPPAAAQSINKQAKAG